MINHARTLLMNIDAQPSFDVTSLGDEIIAPNYKRVQLPGHLNRVRQAIFGSAPDREMLNYRCFQLLRMISESELQEFITDLDPRISYAFDSDHFLDQSLFQPIIEQIAGTPKQLVVTGPPLPPDEQGHMKKGLLIAVGNEVSDLEEGYNFTKGLSEPIPMPGTNGKNFILMHEPQEGDTWRITWRSRPTRDVGELLPLVEAVGGEALIDLFNRNRAAGATEPFKTFRKLFEEHYDLPHRLGAAVLALIYRTEEVRLA